MAAFVGPAEAPPGSFHSPVPRDVSSSLADPGRRVIDVKNLEMSFCGCGFLGIYHVGVAAAFQHFLPECKFGNLSGASAGAIAATGLIAGTPVGESR